VSHHSIQKALLVINNMLKNLKYQMFIHVAADHAARAMGATALMEEFMDASNFGVSEGEGGGCWEGGCRDIGVRRDQGRMG
jgi:hypothetical protein